MVVRKEDIHILVERLQEHDQKTVFDFLQYLIERSEKKPVGWAEIDQAKPDEEPLTKEEHRQLNSDAGYVTGEEAKREFGLQVDLPNAVKFLAKQEKAIQERIALGLKGLIEVPPCGDIKPMKGNQGLYRLRIGTCRVLFEIQHNEKVIHTGHRSSRRGL